MLSFTQLTWLKSDSQLYSNTDVDDDDDDDQQQRILVEIEFDFVYSFLSSMIGVK
jgi:hypothetical protein